MNSYKPPLLSLTIPIRRYARKWWSVSLADGFAGLAQTSLALALVALPFRYRWVLLQRPAPPVYADYTDFLLFPSDLFLILALLFWMIGHLLRPAPIQVVPARLSLPLLLLTTAALISAAGSVDSPLSLYHAAHLLLLAGFYIYLLNQGKVAALILPIAAQVVLQAIIGIAQVLKQSSLGLSRLGELQLHPGTPGVSIVWAEGTRFLRAYGLSDHPNILGGSLAFGLVLILGYFGQATRLQRAWLAGVFLLTSLGVVLTFSRSAWLAFAVGGLFCIFWNIASGRRQEALIQAKLVLGTGILLLPLLWQVAPFLGVRLNLGNSFQTVPYEIQSLGERSLLSEATLRIFTQNPWDGVGLGALPTAMRQAYSQFPVYYQPAHFVLLDVAAEIGLVGAICYLALLLAPWLALWAGRKKLSGSPELGTFSALLLAATIIGLLDHYTWSLAPGRIWQWLIWGMWAAAYNSTLRRKGYV